MNPVSFANPIRPQQKGYIYIWVSNESENTKVWFDDLKVTHRSRRVTQATDYYAYGSVLREQKTPEELTYRYKYQGQYAEKDEETGWEHFELREFDPIIGRWTSKDPKGEFYSPYVGMGNNPISNNDPDGGTTRPPIANGILVPDNFFKRAYNFLFGYQFLNDAYKFGKSHPDIGVFYSKDDRGNYTGASAGGGLWEFGSFDWGMQLPSEGDLIPGPQALVGRSIGTLRRAAVRIAWKEEVELVKRTGQGTRAWTKPEMKELLQRGKVKNYFGHHINSVSANPGLAGEPDNIMFLNWHDHFTTHGHDWAKPTFGDLLQRKK